MDDEIWSVSGPARWTGVLLCHPICQLSAIWDDVLDSIDDDDDNEWPENPFDYREDQNTKTSEELLAMIRFEAAVGFQAKLRKLCEEYFDVFQPELGTNPLRWSLWV